MSRKGMGLAVVLMLAVAWVVAAAPPAGNAPKGGAAPKPAAAQSESSYWNKFKTLFVDWDDNAQPGSPHTEVTGVRGVNIEQALGNKGYDWSAVSYMENFQVSMDDAKKFLQEGRLGPYQAPVR